MGLDLEMVPMSLFRTLFVLFLSVIGCCRGAFQGGVHANQQRRATR